jgi:ParB-like chromosome segregation protein Spo0J
MLEPAAVIQPGKGYSVIGGERRAAAQLQAGQRHVTLYVVRTWREFLAWMLLDEHRRAAAAPLVMDRIDWPMSVLDAAYWTRKVLAHLKTHRSDMADQAMAEHVGREVERIRDARYQLRWLEHHDADVRRYAAEQLKLVHEGLVAASTVGGRITRYVDSKTTMPVERQRAILAAASGQLAGLADALRPLAPALSMDLNDEEIDEALRHFGEGRLQAERVIRALKAIKERRKL